MDEKKRFKMYKAGKTWMVSALSTVTVVSGLGLGSIVANADTTSTPASTTTTATSTPASTTTSSTSTTPATTSTSTPATTTNTTTSTDANSGQSAFDKALSQLQNSSTADQQKAISSLNNTLANPTPFVQQQQVQQQSTDVYTQLANYGIDKNLASEFATGDNYYTQVVNTKIAQLTGNDAINARKLVDQLRSDYRKANKEGVWGVANHDAYEYANPNLSDRQSAAFAKGEEVHIVSMIKDGGKLRYKIADGNYVAAVHVDINMDYTNMDEYNAMVKATTQLRPTVKKHVVKKASATYYVKTPKGKKHVAVIKKSLVAHVNKTFKDNSAKSKKNVLHKGAKVVFKSVVKVGKTYRLHLTNGHYVTANKAFVQVVK